MPVLNPYDSVLEDFEAQRQRAQSAGIAAASTLTFDVNPDAAGKAKQTAAYLGVPAAAVEAMPQEAERAARIRKVDEDTRDAPALRQRYTDADFMKLAVDDSGVLASIEKALRYTVSTPDAPRGGLMTDIGRAARAVASGVPKAGAGLWGVLSAVGGIGDQAVQTLDDAAAFVTRTPRRQIVGTPGPEGFFRDAREQANLVARDTMAMDPNAGFTERAVMSGFQSGGQNLAMLPLGLAGAGGEAAMLTAMGLTTGGESYGEARDKGLSPAHALAHGVQDAVAEVVTEKFLGASGFLQQVKAGASAGKLFMYEVAREVPGEIAATLWQNFNSWANLNPDKSVGQFISEQPAAIGQTIIATLVGGTTQIGAVKGVERAMGIAMGDSKRAQDAAAQSLAMQQLMQLSAASKLRERHAESFEGFLQSATEDGPLEKVFVNPAEAQAAGLDLTQLAEAAPSIANDLQVALETGADVAIPTSELATRLPGTPLEAVLLQHLKTDPAGFSQAGAQVYMQTQGENVRRQVEQILDERQVDDTFRESARKVEEQVHQQLHAANRFTDDVNRPYAALWSNFFAVQAARLGTTPEALFAQYQPRIVAQTSAGALLDQFVPLGQGSKVQQVMDAWTKSVSHLHPNDPDYVLKLPTPAVLRTLGEKARNLELSARRIRSIGNAHKDIPGDVLERLPALLHDPLHVFPHHEGGWDVALDATTAKGEPIVVGVRDGVVRTITPFNDAEISGQERLALNFAASKGRVYARNNEAPVRTGASVPAPDGANSLEALPRNGRIVVTRAALVKQHGEDFYQGDKADVTRGSFNPATNTVALLQAADLSTFLHESGHFFLEVMADMASAENAPAEVVADFNTFLKWTGVADAAAWQAMSLEEKRAHHEDFARGFEAYLFEGKAPSIEVAGLFQRFRAWLLNVYRDISQLNIHLTAEIRGVFDRMVATNEQIQIAQDVRGYDALFKNKPEGMTDDEWVVYQMQANDATQDAIAELQSRSLRDMRWLANAKSRELTRLQKAAKARRGEVEAEVRAEVEAMPVYQAMAAIKEQRKSDPADRHALTDWKAQRDAEEARLLEVIKAEHLDTPEGRATAGIQRGQFLARNKRQIANEAEKMLLQWEQQNPRPKVNIPDADLEAVATLQGFTSADELRKAIEDAQPIKDVIEGMTDQRMLERFGDLASPDAIERAAEEAIHNDARLRFTATEANALNKAVGKPALLAQAIRQFAAEIVGRTRVRDLRPSVYTAAERRAAADAAKSAREGKLEDAAIQKRNQLINGHAAKETLAAQDEATKIVEYLRGFNRESLYKSLDPDYIDQIHQLLERFDLRNQSLKAIDKRTSLSEWLKTQEEAGLEPEIPDGIANEARRVAYKNLTMSELRGLRDTVKQIEHLGRLKHKLLTAKDQRDYEAVRDSIVASIIEHAGDKTADNRTRPTRLDAAIRMFNGYVLEHRKVASLIRELDGFKDGGVMWEYIARTMNEAGDTEATMRAEAADRLAALVKPMLEGGKRGGRGQFFASVGKSFNREERLGIALNLGNAGNVQRLLGGEGWSLEQIKPIVDTLTAADWQFVQSVWDFLETYRPLIAAKERRVYGKEPNWVEPQQLQVQTADGQTISLRGGYFPIKYDPARSGAAEAHAEAQTTKQMSGAAYTSATTRRSFTKARAEEVSGRPLMYSTDALFNGVNEIIHDLAWHEWLIDANRLLNHRGSIAETIRHRYGAEAIRQLKSALRDIAAGEFPGTHAFERGMGQLRAGTVIAGLGLNLMNSIINVQGITQSMVRIGPKWAAVGITRFAAGPIELAREVAEKSEMMAMRAKTMNREVNEIQSLVRDKSSVRAAADRLMFLPLTLTQRIVDTPTWWGAYQKALDEGNAEARAVSLADQAVLDAQSGGQVKDLAAIQRGSPMLKLWTTFYGFFNSTYNLTVEETKATNFRDPLQVVQLAASYLLLWTVPALMGTLLKNLLTGGDWDPEKLAKKAAGDQISYLMGMMVGARDIAGAAQAATGTSEFNMGYGGPAGARFLGELYKLAQQAHQGEADAPFFKALNNIGGMLLHYPATQVNRTVEGAIALKEGRTHNPMALIAGAPPKQ